MSDKLFSFSPHRLLLGGHLQTIAGTLLPAKPFVTPNQDILSIDFENGDQTKIYIDKPEDLQKQPKAMIVLFHGLGGSANSGYNLRLSEKFRARGFHVARYSHRGSDPATGYNAKNIYHCGSYNDLQLGLELLQGNFPDFALYAVGFSLSGTALLNLLSKKYKDVASKLPSLKAALTVCPPLDLESSSLRVSSLKNLIFDRYFSLVLAKQIRIKEQTIPELPRSNIQPWRGLRVFDETYTAKLGGFKNREDYYHSSSPAKLLHDIIIPTTILGAADDPISCPEAYRQGTKNPLVKIILTKTGGHMGFISRKPTSHGDHRWMDEFVVRWVMSHLDR